MPELDIERYSSTLDWKQFEALAELAFKSYGYETKKNFRLKKPTTEIDLIASSKDICFAVDCKHWKRTVGASSMMTVAQKQIIRCETLVKQKKAKRAVPLILTLHDEYLSVLENGVAIVPIQKISDFLLNWETSRDRIKIVER